MIKYSELPTGTITPNSMQQPRDIVWIKYNSGLKAYNMRYGRNISLNCYLCLKGLFNGKKDLINEILNFDRFKEYRNVAIYNNNKPWK